jgi:nucleoside-diphosphate-sugar epimerase
MAIWLVTGGAGFIGSNIVAELLHRGERARILDNFATGREENLASLPAGFELIRGDVRDLEVCRRAVAGVDYVLHQAALGSVPRSIENPLETHAANVTGTVNLLVAARDAKVKRFVCAGSSSIYGNNPTLPKREDMLPMPISPYAVTKLAQEQYCLSFAEVYGLETAVLRYFNIYGPRQDPDSQYSAVIPRFFRAALAGRPPEIYGDGEQSRDFTFVADCVEANLLAAVRPLRQARVFNVAGGRRVSVNEIWREIRRLAGTTVEPNYLPARPGDVRHSLADTAAARADLGWEPRVALAEGLEITRRSYG